MLQPASIPSGWSSQVVTSPDWQPHLEGVDAERVNRLTRGDIVAFEYRGLYQSQRQGKEIDGYNNDLLGGLRLSSGFGTPESLAGPRILHAEDPRGRQSLIVISYRVSGERISNAWQAQLRYAALSLLRMRSAPSVVEVLRVNCDSGCGAASDALKELWEQPS
jgi:hypothetical protein